MIDVEDRQFLDAELVDRLEQLLGDLLAGFGVDFAGFGVDEVLGDVIAEQFLVGHAERLQALLRELTRLTHGDLLAGVDHDLAAVGIDQIVDRLVALHAIGIERHAPAFLGALVGNDLVEGPEDFLAVHAERIEQRRHRDLAATVDARMHDVLGVELDVEPGAAIRNDAGGEQQLARGMGLALVVIEEHAGRTMHLGDDDALGAVHDERTVVRHQRDVAHIDILLLDVLHGAGAGLFVDIEHDQPQRHLQRRRIGHAALAALVNVVFRRIEFVADEVELRGVGKILDREDGFEHRLQALVGPPARRRRDQQELVVGCLLNLDEVRHLRHFLNFSEKFSNALPTDKRLRLAIVSFSRLSLETAGTTLRKAAIIATIRTGVGVPAF